MFLDYKQETQERINLIKQAEIDLQHVNLAYASKAPVMEAAFGLAEKSKLRMYDCLVPVIAEHSYQMGQTCKQCLEKAYDAGYGLYTAKSDTQKISRLFEKNKKLKAQHAEIVKENAQLRHEAETIDYYIQVYEGGRDTKELVALYTESEKKRVSLGRLYKSMKKRLEKECARLIQKNNTTMETLKKQQVEVVYPLVSECSKREKEIVEYKEMIISNSKIVKMLSALLKFPKLCESYRRITKLRLTEEELNDAKSNATHVLRQFKLDQDPINTNKQLEKLASDLAKFNKFVKEKIEGPLL